MTKKFLLKAERKKFYLKIANLMLQGKHEEAEGELLLMMAKDVGVYVLHKKHFETGNQERNKDEQSDTSN